MTVKRSPYRTKWGEIWEPVSLEVTNWT